MAAVSIRVWSPWLQDMSAHLDRPGVYFARLRGFGRTQQTRLTLLEP